MAVELNHGPQATVEQATGERGRPVLAGDFVDISVVLPCLDEARTLGLCLDNAFGFLALAAARHGLTGEVIVADNGSRDDSATIAAARGASVVAVEERGYGNALRGGVAASRGRFIVMGDCDGSYDFADALAMVERLAEGYELCLGTRLKGRIEPGAMPWLNRYLGNPVLTGILNLLFRSGLSDAHCGLRAFTRDAYERLRLTSEGMEFASEMVIKASLLGLRRTEVSITLHRDRRDRRPHLRPWRDGWRHLRYLLMLSPKWLFFVPSAVMAASSIFLLAVLLPNPAGEVVRIGPIWFGDHWMVVAGALLLLSHNFFVFGLATMIYGVRAGYRTMPRLSASTLRLFTLEAGCMIGAAMAAGGLAGIAWIVAEWSAGDFGALDRVRELIAAVALLIVGMQTVSSAFLLAIVAGNRADFLHTKQR